LKRKSQLRRSALGEGGKMETEKDKEEAMQVI
jgi:hypothetical protein